MCYSTGMSTKTFEVPIVWQKAHNLRPLLDEAIKLLEAYIRGVERNAAASSPRS